MAWEVDFLAVGEGEKSGDAIALRWGNLSGPRPEQTIFVIDGGTQDSGERLVEHIQKFYGTTKVDAVILSHPDADHASGLAVVLEKLEVDRLFMHQPWNHAEYIAHLFNDGRVTPTGIEDRAWEALRHARELEKIAERKGIPIIEPFSDNGSAVLSPSRAFYQEQLVRFRCMPEQKEKRAQAELYEQFSSILLGAVRALETWFKETLADPDSEATSGENNSSVVLLLDLGAEKFLFTADAGVPALEQAVACAVARGVDLKTVKYLQIPHHGSRRNIGPTVLNEILGPILQPDSPQGKTAFVSAAKDSPKHPAKRVVNAFKRRGAKVYATQGKSIRQSSKDAPPRTGWTSASELPFFDGESDD